MNKLLLICGILFITANITIAEFDNYSYQYIKAYPGTTYTTNSFNSIVSGSETASLGSADPFYMKTISFNASGSLPDNLANTYVPPPDQDTEEDSDGVIHTWNYSGYFILGTVAQSAAQQGHDKEYDLNEIHHTQSRSLNGTNWTAWTHSYQTNLYKYYFRIDDWADNLSTSSHVCRLSISPNYTNGFLHSETMWYPDGENLATTQTKTRTIPADIDCFSVPALQTFILDVVSSNFEVEVDGDCGFYWSGNYLSTNLGFFTFNYDFTVKANNSTNGGSYLVRARAPKSIILVHGIMTHPINESEIAERKVFCNDLDLLLEDLNYNVRFLCYDAGSTDENAIKNQIADLKSLIEECYEDSNSQKVTIIAHSWGNIMCDLCHEFYRLTDNLFNEKVDKYISVGGPHSGSPVANIYKDVNGEFWLFKHYDYDLAAWKGCADAYKDAPEMGSSYMQYTSQSPFTNIVALNGKWGTYPDEYYEKQMRHSFLPRKAPLETLDTMMEGLSDGFIPDYSACSTKFIPDSDNRKLVFNDSNKGMSHSRKNLIWPFGDDIFHSEFGITKEDAADHGVFLAITNLLAGGTLNDISSSYVESLPANTKGAECRVVTISGTNAKKFRHVYAIINNEEIELCTQDDDTAETSRRFPKALSDGGPEAPYKILVAPNGVYDIYSKRFHTDIDYSFVFDYNFTNSFPFIDIIELDADVSVTFYETTSSGQFSVVGGKVEINNSQLILNAN